MERAPGLVNRWRFWVGSGLRVWKLSILSSPLLCTPSIWLLQSSVLLWQTGHLVQLERRRKRRDYITKNRNETGKITENVWVDPHKKFQSCVFLRWWEFLFLPLLHLPISHLPADLSGSLQSFHPWKWWGWVDSMFLLLTHEHLLKVCRMARACRIILKVTESNFLT